MKKIKTLIFCLLFAVTVFGQERIKNSQDLSNHFPSPKVDKRVELLSIVFRLAGNREYNGEFFKEYVKDIHDHFDRYKDHPLITFAKELHDKNGVAYDAVMAMSVHLEQPPALTPVLPFTSGTPENRWGENNANKFVKLLQEFYVDAKCEAFFNQHEELYKLAQERFKTVYDALDISWYKEYYGKQPEGSLNIILGLGNGGGNYGSKIVFPDGREDDFAIMGAWSFDNHGKPVYSSNGFLPTLIHEFNHSFVNQLIERNKNELENAGKQLFEPVKDIMKRQAYGNWQTMMKEALVRASVIRYIKKHSTDSKAADNEMIAQLGNGFVWMGMLVDTLQVYENSRDKYPTLESFMPCIVSFYNALAKDSNSLYENCAHVISIEPFNNNSTEVSPDLTEVKVTFDKPLSGKGYSVFLGQKGIDHFPVVPKGVRYEDNNSSIILNLKLKADTEYEFVLVGQKFTTPEGYPLIDYKVAFKTK
jgi:hypothetical protein